jgi:hypothetical protein
MLPDDPARESFLFADPDRIPRMRFSPILCLPLVLANACTWWSSQEHVMVTSDPLGARILVDGTDTGKTTPSRLHIGGNFGGDHVIELRLAGYRPTRRTVYQYTEGYTSKWIDGVTNPPSMPPLPFFWTAGDVVFPFGIRGAITPDVHVKLYREDEPPIGYEVLALKAVQPPPSVK